MRAQAIICAERRVTGTPLLHALYRIVYQGRDVERELRAACFPQSTPLQGGTP